MKTTTISLHDAVGSNGLISDGDWIESKDQDLNGGVRLIQLADIGDGTFLNKSRKFITTDTVERLNCTLLHEGDVLVARMPDPLGRACVFPKIDKQAITAVDVCIIRTDPGWLDPDWLAYYLNSPSVRSEMQNHAQGATRARVPTGKVRQLIIQLPAIEYQRSTVARLEAQLAELRKARAALDQQICETGNLADAIILDSIRKSGIRVYSLGDVLEEVKNGIGDGWASFPVWGATRDGLAPAKEPPGKKPERYKPAFPGTVFYNPMRILIGSIAFLDDDDKPGITSPDYVALTGKKDIVDSRWFYFWLRSPLGKQCITSLARGAVRERMLFNRLAEGAIELPDFKLQQSASKALAELKHLRKAIEIKMNEIDLLPAKILSQVFER